MGSTVEAAARAHLAAAARMATGGRWDLVGREASAALALDPTIAEAHRLLSVALKETGETWRAVAEAKEAVRLRPGSAANHVTLASAFSARGRGAEALEASREAMRLAPTAVSVRINLVFSLARMRRPGEALALADETLMLAPSDANVHNARAVALIGLGRHPEAHEVLETALAREPAAWAYHNNLGLVFLSQGLFRDAREEFLEALRLKPDDPVVARNLSRTTRLGLRSSGVPGGLTARWSGRSLPLRLLIGSLLVALSWLTPAAATFGLTSGAMMTRRTIRAARVQPALPGAKTDLALLIAIGIGCLAALAYWVARSNAVPEMVGQGLVLAGFLGSPMALTAASAWVATGPARMVAALLLIANLIAVGGMTVDPAGAAAGMVQTVPFLLFFLDVFAPRLLGLLPLSWPAWCAGLVEGIAVRIRYQQLSDRFR